MSIACLDFIIPDLLPPNSPGPSRVDHHRRYRRQRRRGRHMKINSAHITCSGSIKVT